MASREGRGAAVVIEGEPGIGKTTLIGAAASPAEGLRRLDTTGLEAESSIPFAALAELTQPLLPGLSALPAPQRTAIEGALALAPTAPGDRFAVCAGLLGLLDRAAREQPLLVTVDDAQWLDRASAECLAYAARRLAGRPILLLAAARAGQPHPFDGPTVQRIELGGLEDSSARTLLDALAPTLPDQVARSLLAAAAGNPMALIELPALLSDEQRRGDAPLDDPLPPGITLQRAFEARIARIPADARDACLIGAAAFGPALAPIKAACSELGIDPASFERAEEAGMIRLSPERIEFEHPLLRGAVYAGATASERRRAHLALSRHTDDDSSAWHRAAAAVGPDPEVASELEAAARRAEKRGAHGAAADAFERAARLSDRPAARTERLIAAGTAASVGGAYDRGAALMELADEIDDPRVRALLRHRLAMVSLNGGVRDAHEIYVVLTEEADEVAPGDAAAAASMHADAGVAAAVTGNCRAVLRSAERAAALIPDAASAVTRCQVESILGLGLVLTGRGAEGASALDRAGALLPMLDLLSPSAQTIAFALGGRRSTGQDAVLRDEAGQFEAAAREAGALGMFPYFQILIADCAYRMGDWDLAAAQIAQGIEGAEESAQRSSLSIGLAISARLSAARGEERAARAAATRGAEIAEAHALGSSIGWCRATIGFLELTLGRADEAIAELEPLEQLFELSGLDDPLIVPSAPDLVEAYVRADRIDDAKRAAATLAGRAKRNGTPAATGLAKRCRGLVEPRAFDRSFEAAIGLHAEAGVPFELARTRLAFGSRLHRARRRPEARKQLREALAIFERLGAAPWVELTRAELRAAGAVRRDRVGDPDELTAQEVRVALRVARGATNREVATELFLSPKTIEFHLGRVYRKLGIHSRTELAAASAEGRLQAAVAAPEKPAGTGTHGD